MRLAEELDTTWQIHLSETEEERQNAIKEFGCSPVEYLAKLGCLNERTLPWLPCPTATSDCSPKAAHPSSTVP